MDADDHPDAPRGAHAETLGAHPDASRNAHGAYVFDIYVGSNGAARRG